MFRAKEDRLKVKSQARNLGVVLVLDSELNSNSAVGVKTTECLNDLLIPYESAKTIRSSGSDLLSGGQLLTC